MLTLSRRFRTLVRSELADALQSQYGIAAPNALQRDALQSALTGKDMLLVAQTGSGKTLCSLRRPELHHLVWCSRHRESLQCSTRASLRRSPMPCPRGR